MPKPKSGDRAGKTAILSELLGPERLAALRLSDAAAKGQTSKSDPALLAWHKNRLIEKFREKGLLPGSGSPAAATAEPQPQRQTSPKVTKKAKTENGPDYSISARLAAHLDPDRLTDEHPAVLAVLLRSQPAQTRSEVLRGLPGAQARAVMRLLRSKREQQTEIQGEVAKPMAPEQTPIASELPQQKRKISTRRSR